MSNEQQWRNEELPSGRTNTPIAPSYDGEEGFQCICPNADNGKHSCDQRSRIEGSAAFVTGAFGLACASVVVRAFCDR